MRCDWESATHGLARLVELAAFTKQFKLKEYVKAYNLNETDAAALEEYCSEAVNARSFLHYMPWSWGLLLFRKQRLQRQAAWVPGLSGIPGHSSLAGRLSETCFGRWQATKSGVKFHTLTAGEYVAQLMARRETAKAEVADHSGTKGPACSHLGA
ncbi:unnamed protein product [Effrenium voratum]|nr:unnamed protein product [Effrenium voratum]